MDRQAHAVTTTLVAADLDLATDIGGDATTKVTLGRDLGNLGAHEWDLARLWNGAAARALRTRIREQRCKCTWECAQADNVLFRARSWPALAQKALFP